MNNPDNIIYRSEFHPHPPLQVLEFLKYELQVGRKYVVMVSGEGTEHFGRLWLKHVNLLCLLEEDKEYHRFIVETLGEQPNLWTAAASLKRMPLDEDSIDSAVLIGEGFNNTLSSHEITAELQRCLRLNSYVLGLRHRLTTDTERTFSWAFSHFFRQYTLGPDHEYDSSPDENSLGQFFKSGYERKLFPNQVRLDWDGLQGYYIASHNALPPDDPKFKWAIKALHILFEQYQTDGEVLLDYQTELYYGLFNKFVPAISLRKNIFFTLLRPFAFGFYVLVKLNVYFWKMLGKLFRFREKKRV